MAALELSVAALNEKIDTKFNAVLERNEQSMAALLERNDTKVNAVDAKLIGVYVLLAAIPTGIIMNLPALLALLKSLS
jgi:hypothetical protein